MPPNPPSAINCSTVPRPIPEAPPVTMIRWLRNRMCFPLCNSKVSGHHRLDDPLQLRRVEVFVDAINLAVSERYEDGHRQIECLSASRRDNQPVSLRQNFPIP